jgi:hypothetical protein
VPLGTALNGSYLPSVFETPRNARDSVYSRENAEAYQEFNRVGRPVSDRLSAARVASFFGDATTGCGREGEIANGRIGAFQFAESGFS